MNHLTCLRKYQHSLGLHVTEINEEAIRGSLSDIVITGFYCYIKHENHLRSGTKIAINRFIFKITFYTKDNTRISLK
jgi:hypothetical protein